jgi:hypothetical protein
MFFPGPPRWVTQNRHRFLFAIVAFKDRGSLIETYEVFKTS